MKHLCQIGDDALYVSSFQPIDSRMYLLVHGKRALAIDPFVDRETLGMLRAEGVTEVTVLPTHEHYDHISGICWLKENFVCHVAANTACARNMRLPMRNFSAIFEALFLDDPEKLEEIRALHIGSYSCEADIVFEGEQHGKWQTHDVDIYLTPGHSEGSAVLCLDKKYLFTGDSLLNGTPTVTRLPGGSKKSYADFTKPFLQKLSAGCMVFPGHGECFSVAP